MCTLLGGRPSIRSSVPPQHTLSPKTTTHTHTQGFKITDLQQLDRFRVDRTALMTRVCQSYFTQFFLDGFFNADPHVRTAFCLI